MNSSITLDHVKKVYNNTNVVIPDLSALIHEGEFFTLLGPSGCGKTTLLRMIAGFNTIEAGEIKFGETVINNIPTHKRNIGMVFQNYAIFPHMTVRENVEYGLKIRKEISKEERKRLVDDIMETVKITEYADRKPDQLSGGQQQRVALARAIVIKPDVLLMDEPLSNLDAKLRIEMRTVIKEIQHHVGITTVYVTHDQEEALAVSDRIAVMDAGVIQQLDKPEVIYSRPYNTNVANFIGRSNFFKGQMKRGQGNYTIKVADYQIEVDTVDEKEGDQNVIVAVRPEEFLISEDMTVAGMTAEIITSTFLGKYMNYVMKLSDGTEIEVSLDSGVTSEFHEVGKKVKLSISPKKVNIFTEDGSRSLIKGVKRYAE